jgi:hypothetical protein
MAQILPMLTRARAFYSQGVLLSLPARSRSGVRNDDGMVVFAMAAMAVHVDEWGCTCPLWLPAHSAEEEGVDRDRAVSEELLEHCRIAMRQGLAEGFLLYGDAALARASEVLALRVVKAGKEYWAKWGAVARAEPPRHHACAAAERPR